MKCRVWKSPPLPYMVNGLLCIHTPVENPVQQLETPLHWFAMSYSKLQLFLSALCWGSTSCSNGGTCRSPNSCSCRAGWTGSRCTTGNIITVCISKFTVSGNRVLKCITIQYSLQVCKSTCPSYIARIKICSANSFNRRFILHSYL